MVNTALTYFLVSIFVGTLLVVIVRKERRRGRRFFASSVRDWLDAKVQGGSDILLKSWEHFSKYIVQLSWYYSIHSVLRTLLRMIVAVYTYFENAFELNRNRTKQLRAEKRQLNELNHLHQMTAHKQETALSPAEQKKLRQKKLDEKH
ncbi:hypothetical protein H6781_00325 [Candidatus Nomurabacteria bacterium]|nr:hypothetical protein [Candidatus Kaiserbacteria bacterium]MCB9810028.1 hypothetical protein [Candidatus Nomurabacteria bacterium]